MKTTHTLHLLLCCCLFISSNLINAQCHIDDWTALKAFYEATDGDNWSYKYSWDMIKNEEPPLDCNLGDLDGVGLDETGRVNTIEIIYGGLDGSITHKLGDLSYLTVLDLSGNRQLDSKIPSALSNLNKLKKLKLYANSLRGEIPPELGDLSDLEELDLSSNVLHGNIPPELGNLDKLLKVDLGYNLLSGNIPSELTNLSKLNFFALGGNNLVGSIPPELGNLADLTYLSLGNRLTGSIPPELGNLVKLTHLILDDNELVGSIPKEIENLILLEELYLSKNKLSGSIPSEIGNLTGLEELHLENNELTGRIPPEIGNLTKLTKLPLFDNQLSGSIPPEIGNLNKLTSLSLHNNKLSGRIPPEMGNLINLTELPLFDNNLSGSIPPEIGNLSNLVKLELYDNQLSGSLPPEIGNMNQLEGLDLYNNNLSGEVPSELFKMPNLNWIDLNNNQISSLPSVLSSSSQVRGLDLSNNQISGSIPSGLFNLHKLGWLDLSKNKLSGIISPEFGNLIELDYIDLSNNQLSGSIPQEISNISYLEEFYVSHNQLSGSIPKLNPWPNGVWAHPPLKFLVTHNNFTCNDIKSFNYEEFNHSFMVTGDPVFIFTPQNYIQNEPQSFIIEDSLTAISLTAPISITGNFQYQWYLNEVSIAGATDSILLLNNVKVDDVGEYTLGIIDIDCQFESYYSNYYEYISDPISVRRTDLEGCTDTNSCNYNEFAFIDDGSCEYIWCDTMSNPIKIRTTNETILSDTQIKFDIVIDSLDLDYSADGLTFNLDTRGNYRIESIEVVNPILSIAEVDISKLYKNTLSINRINSQRLASGTPILSVTACIAILEVPSEESTCSHFVIQGGTELSSGHFIDFNNVYIDIPFSDCSPYGNYGAEGKNWLPLVLTISPQNCNDEVFGLAEIKILEEGQGPFAYTLKNEEGSIVLESTSQEKLIELPNLNAGNYELTVFDMDGKKTTMHTCVPLVNRLNGNTSCNMDCVDYVIVPDGEISGRHQAKKEVEIKGFVSKNETVEFSICE